MTMRLVLLILAIACLGAADTALLPSDALAGARLAGAAVKASTARFDPVGGSLRLEIRDAASDPWGIQVLLPVAAGLAKGDPLRLSLRLRCVEKPAAGEAELAVFVQRGEKPYGKVLNRRIKPGQAWQDVVVDGIAGEDIPAGKVQVGLFLGISQGVFEIAGLRLEHQPR